MTVHGRKAPADQLDSASQQKLSECVSKNTTRGLTVSAGDTQQDDFEMRLEGKRTHAKAPWWPDSYNTPPENVALSQYMLDIDMHLHCRLDVRLTSHEELKHAAYQLEILAKKLTSIAFDGQADPVLRVLVARKEMKRWQRVFLLHGKRNQAKRDAIGSVRKSKDIRKLNREKLFDQPIDSKGEDDQ